MEYLILILFIIALLIFLLLLEWWADWYVSWGYEPIIHSTIGKFLDDREYKKEMKNKKLIEVKK